MKVNIVYKDDQGETIKTDQRDISVTFEMELTPADIAAAEAQNKTIDDLVEEQVLLDLQSALTAGQVVPSVSIPTSRALQPGPALGAVSMGEAETENTPNALIEQG